MHPGENWGHPESSASAEWSARVPDINMAWELSFRGFLVRTGVPEVSEGIKGMCQFQNDPNGPRELSSFGSCK